MDGASEKILDKREDKLKYTGITLNINRLFHLKDRL